MYYIMHIPTRQFIYIDTYESAALFTRGEIDDYKIDCGEISLVRVSCEEEFKKLWNMRPQRNYFQMELGGDYYVDRTQESMDEFCLVPIKRVDSGESNESPCD